MSVEAIKKKLGLSQKHHRRNESIVLPQVAFLCDATNAVILGRPCRMTHRTLPQHMRTNTSHLKRPPTVRFWSYTTNMWPILCISRSSRGYHITGTPSVRATARQEKSVRTTAHLLHALLHHEEIVGAELFHVRPERGRQMRKLLRPLLVFSVHRVTSPFPILVCAPTQSAHRPVTAGTHPPEAGLTARRRFSIYHALHQYTHPWKAYMHNDFRVTVWKNRKHAPHGKDTVRCVKDPGQVERVSEAKPTTLQPCTRRGSPSPESPMSTNVDTFKLACVAEFIAQKGKGARMGSQINVCILA